jgi:hypothetical protein
MKGTSAAKTKNHSVQKEQLQKCTEVISPTTTQPMTINKAHAMLGHMGQEDTRAICKHYDLRITKRGFQPCVSCGKSKAKQAAVIQHNEEHEVAGVKGRRFFLDVSSTKHGDNNKRPTSKPYWLLIVEEEAQAKFSFFLETKNKVSEVACRFFYDMKNKGTNVKYVQLDNAKENMKLAHEANGMGVFRQFVPFGEKYCKLLRPWVEFVSKRKAMNVYLPNLAKC